VPAPPRGAIEVAALHASARGAHVAVVGAGPAGLFATLVLARNGARVTLIDRGPGLRERGHAVAAFGNRRVPDPEANLLFGEGGAGTYSDGKLYTRVEHPLEVPLLEELVACGAPPEVLYDARAHVGTDRLHRILPRLRGGSRRARDFTRDSSADGRGPRTDPGARDQPRRARLRRRYRPGHRARYLALRRHGVVLGQNPSSSACASSPRADRCGARRRSRRPLPPIRSLINRSNEAAPWLLHVPGARSSPASTTRPLVRTARNGTLLSGWATPRSW
jgi:hypothetical protein